MAFIPNETNTPVPTAKGVSTSTPVKGKSKVGIPSIKTVSPKRQTITAINQYVANKIVPKKGWVTAPPSSPAVKSPAPQAQEQKTPEMSLDPKSKANKPMYFNPVLNVVTTTPDGGTPVFWKTDPKTKLIYITDEETEDRVIYNRDSQQLLNQMFAPVFPDTVVGNLLYSRYFENEQKKRDEVADLANEKMGIGSSLSGEDDQLRPGQKFRFNLKERQALAISADSSYLLPGQWQTMVKVGDNQNLQPLVLSPRPVATRQKFADWFNRPVEMVMQPIYQKAKTDPELNLKVSMFDWVFGGGLTNAIKSLWYGMQNSALGQMQSSAAMAGTMTQEQWGESIETIKQNVNEVTKLSLADSNKAVGDAFAAYREADKAMRQEAWADGKISLSEYKEMVSPVFNGAFAPKTPEEQKAVTDKAIQADNQYAVSQRIVNSGTGDVTELAKAEQATRAAILIDIENGYATELLRPSHVNPYWSATFQSQPDKYEEFVNNLVQSSLLKQYKGLGARLTEQEIVDIKAMSTDPLTEFMVYAVADPTNLIPFDKLFSWIPAARRLAQTKGAWADAFKLYGEFSDAGKIVNATDDELRILNKTVVNTLLDRSSQAKFFIFKQAARSKAMKGAAVAKDAFGNLARGVNTPEEFIEAVGNAAEATKILGKSEDVVSTLPKLPVNMGAKQKVELQELGRLWDPDAWQKTAESALASARNRLLKTAQETVRKASKGVLSEPEIIAEAERIVSRQLKPMHVAELLADEFRVKLINGSRIWHNAQVLDDGIIGQLAKIPGFKESKIGQMIRWTADTNTKIMSVWYNSVLSLRPAWVIRNYQDNIGRFVISGGKWGADIKQVVKDIGEVPAEAFQSMSPTMVSDPSSLVWRVFEEGWTPTTFFDHYRYRAKELYRDLKFVWDKDKKLSSIAQNIGNIFRGGLINPVKTLSQGTGDWNSFVEISFRLRLYHTKYMENLEIMKPILESDVLGKLRPDLRDAGRAMLAKAGNDPVKMAELIKTKDNVLYSYLVPDSVDEIMKGLSPADKALFVHPIQEQLEKLVIAKRAAKEPITEADVNKLFSGIVDRIEEYQRDMLKAAQEALDNRVIDMAAEAPDANKAATIMDEVMAEVEPKFRPTDEAFDVVKKMNQTGEKPTPDEIKRILGENKVVIKPGETPEQALARFIKSQDSPTIKVREVPKPKSKVTVTSDLAEMDGDLIKQAPTSGKKSKVWSPEYEIARDEEIRASQEVHDLYRLLDGSPDDVSEDVKAAFNRMDFWLSDVMSRNRDLIYAKFPFSDAAMTPEYHRWAWKNFEIYHTQSRWAQAEIRKAQLEMLKNGTFDPAKLNNIAIDYYKKAGIGLKFDNTNQLERIDFLLKVDGFFPASIKKGPELNQIKQAISGLKGENDFARIVGGQSMTEAQFIRSMNIPQPKLRPVKVVTAVDVAQQTRIREFHAGVNTYVEPNAYTDASKFVNPKTSPITNGQWGIITAEFPNGITSSSLPEDILKQIDGASYRVYDGATATEKVFKVKKGEAPLDALTRYHKVRNAQLKKELELAGYKPIEAVGNYGAADEYSWLVPGMSNEAALDFGKRFNQEAVLTPVGYIKQNGTVQPADLAKTFFNKDDAGQPLTEYFTRIKIGDKDVSFRLNWAGEFGDYSAKLSDYAPKTWEDAIRGISRLYNDDAGRTVLGNTNQSHLSNILKTHLKSNFPQVDLTGVKSNLGDVIKAMKSAGIVDNYDDFVDVVTGAFNANVKQRYQVQLPEIVKDLKDSLRKSFVDEWGQSEEFVDNSFKWFDYRAEQWAKDTGKTPEEWWINRIAAVRQTDADYMPRILYMKDGNPVWFNPLETAIKDNLKDARYRSGMDVLNVLNGKPGVKSDAVEVSGLREWLMNITEQDLKNGYPIETGKTLTKTTKEVLENPGQIITNVDMDYFKRASQGRDKLRIGQEPTNLREGFAEWFDSTNPKKYKTFTDELDEFKPTTSEEIFAYNKASTDYNSQVQIKIVLTPEKRGGLHRTYQFKDGVDYASLKGYFDGHRTDPISFKGFRFEVNKIKEPEVRIINSLTPQDVLDYVNNHSLYMKENVANSSNAKFSSYALTAPREAGIGDPSTYFEYKFVLPDYPRTTGHFEENTVAFSRGFQLDIPDWSIDDQVRSLHIDEIQSDVHENARDNLKHIRWDLFKKYQNKAVRDWEDELDHAVSAFNLKYGTEVDSTVNLMKPTEDYKQAYSIFESGWEAAHPKPITPDISDPDAMKWLETQVTEDEMKLLKSGGYRYSTSGSYPIPAKLEPDYPFKKTYPELAMKRMIRKAVDDGLDGLTWTTGAQQVSRYGDVKISWEQVGDNEWKIYLSGRHEGQGIGRPIGIVKSFEDVRQLPHEIGNSWAETLWKKIKATRDSGDVKDEVIKIPQNFKQYMPRILENYAPDLKSALWKPGVIESLPGFDANTMTKSNGSYFNDYYLRYLVDENELEALRSSGDLDLSKAVKRVFTIDSQADRDLIEAIELSLGNDDEFKAALQKAGVTYKENVIIRKKWGPSGGAISTGGSYMPMQEGMENYYDKWMAEYLNKLGKKYGGVVEDIHMTVGKGPQVSEIAGGDFIVRAMNGDALSVNGNFINPINDPTEVRYFATRAEALKVASTFPDASKDVTIHGFKFTDEFKKFAAEPKPLYMVDKDGLKRAGIMFQKDGRGLIAGFLKKGNTPLDALHELTHAAIIDIDSKDWNVLSNWLENLPEHQKVSITGGEFRNFHAQVVDGTISPENFAKYERAQENINDAIIKTMVEGTMPVSPEVQTVLQKIVKWIKEWYDKMIAGGRFEIEVPTEVRRVFGKMFGSIPDEPVEGAFEMTDDLAEFWKTLQASGQVSDDAALDMTDPNTFIKTARQKASQADMSGDLNSRDYYNDIANNVEGWTNQLQDYLSAVAGKPNVTQKIPPIPKAKLPLEYQEWYSLNKEASVTISRSQKALLTWKDYLVDMTKKAAKGDPDAFFFGKQTDEFWDEMGKWAASTSSDLQEMRNTAKFGGTWGGKNINSALTQMNNAMLDYTDSTTFDSFMRNIYPFWMFPSRSIPFWAKTLASHPQIAIWYQKYLMMSERMQYQNGLITSTGEPLPSFRGYIKLPGTNIWINPTAALSFRYVLNPIMGATSSDNRFVDDENTELGPLESAIQSIYTIGQDYGFQINPFLQLLPPVQNTLGDAVTSTQNIIPQLDLMPLHWRETVLGDLARMKYPNLANMVAAEVPWKDYLVENAALKDVLQQIQLATGDTTKQYQLAMDYRNMLMTVDEDGKPARQTSPMWKKYERQVEDLQLTQSWVSQFTGIYGKPWTDADAALLQLRHENNLLRNMINNNIGAYLFDLAPDASTRYEDYLQKRYESPEGLLYSLSQAIRYVTDESGDAVKDPRERLEILNERLAQDVLNEDYYRQAKELRMEYEAAMAKVPIGSPYDITEPIRKAYYEAKSELDGNPLYANREKVTWSPINKPEEAMLDHYRFNWFQTLRGTFPPFDVNKETSEEYAARKLAWEASLSKQASALAAQYRLQIEKDVVTLFPLTPWGQAMNASGVAGVDLADRILQQLISETTVEGMQSYYRKNDTINDALMSAYDALYLDIYIRDVLSQSGDKREVALQNFNTKYPVSYLTPQIMAKWVNSQPDYAGRWTEAELARAYAQAGVTGIEQRQEIGKTIEETKVSQAFDVMSWADPGKEYSALLAEAEKLGIDDGFIPLLYAPGGSSVLALPKNQEYLNTNLDILQRAAMKLAITAPTGAQLTLRIQARDENELMKEKAMQALGPTLFEDMGVYYAGSYADQAEYRKLYPEKYAAIKQYSAFKDTFGKMYPIWKMFYDPDTKKTSTGGGGSGGSSSGSSSGGSNGYSSKSTKGLTVTGDSSLDLSYKLRDDFIQMGKRSTLFANQLLSGTRLGAGGVAGKPTWPKELMDALGDLMMAEFIRSIEAQQPLSQAAVNYLSKLRINHPEWTEYIDELNRMVKEAQAKAQEPAVTQKLEAIVKPNSLR